MDADLHLVFASGPVHYALPANDASEVVAEPGEPGQPELVSVPGMPAHILGVFIHRGEMVPLLDLSRLVDGVFEPERAGRRAVLMRVEKGLLGFVAREVLGVLPVTGAPKAMSDSGIQQFLKAPARVPDADVTVIEADGLWSFLSGNFVSERG